VPEVEFDVWAWMGQPLISSGQSWTRDGVAFFLRTSHSQSSRNRDSGMVSIDVAYIPTDEPVNFKAYIYLQQNNKYYLFCVMGGT